MGQYFLLEHTVGQDGLGVREVNKDQLLDWINRGALKPDKALSEVSNGRRWFDGQYVIIKGQIVTPDVAKVVVEEYSLV